MNTPPHTTKDLLLSNALEKIRFRFVQPDQPGAQWDTTELEKPTAYKGFDVANTHIWDQQTPVFDLNLLRTPRLSTVAIAYLFNILVQQMPKNETYLNIGTWCGFSFFSGIIGNPEKKCIGVDNFSNHHPIQTRTILHQQYQTFRNNNTVFYEMDYENYFKEIHRGPIGVYFYDGDHAYEHQLKGLEYAHPYLTRGSYTVVDDTNDNGALSGKGDPYEATLAFVDAHPGEYSIVLDVHTHENGHPTFWNGLLILKKTI